MTGWWFGIFFFHNLWDKPPTRHQWDNLMNRALLIMVMGPSLLGRLKIWAGFFDTLATLLQEARKGPVDVDPFKDHLLRKAWNNGNEWFKPPKQRFINSQKGFKSIQPTNCWIKTIIRSTIFLEFAGIPNLYGWRSSPIVIRCFPCKNNLPNWSFWGLCLFFRDIWTSNNYSYIAIWLITANQHQGCTRSEMGEDL